MRAGPKAKGPARDFVPCRNCRARHVKCDGQIPKCQRCSQNGLECNRSRDARFRYGIETDRKPNFVFPQDQIWVPLSRRASALNTSCFVVLEADLQVSFHDESQHVKEYYEAELDAESASAGTLISYGPDSFAQAGILVFRAGRDDISSRRQHLQITSQLPLPETRQDLSERATTSSYHVATSSSSHLSVTGSVVSAANKAIHFKSFTNREAVLMRNFTENMALWADVTDIERHFEIEVPRRALTNLMLRCAIFAFSSRHLAQQDKPSNLTEALEYHNQALSHLIPQLSRPDEELNEDIFVAVLILRLDEEWHEYDNRFHLQGATRILNSISSFILSGGLGEAAAWLCLRQDIAISVASQQPLSTALKYFRTCQSIRKENDLSWALKMVLYLSMALTHAFLPRTKERYELLQQLSVDIHAWHIEKPISYEPIKTIPRRSEHGNCIPVLWMLSPFHVLGAVYYHMAKIVLLRAEINIEEDSVQAITTSQHVHRIEKSVREHLMTILGLALSNPRSQNTLYSAMHSLEAWAGVLRHKLDQEAAFEFLHFAENALGWKMQRVLEKLQVMWHENSDND